jgi:hypothetical protein
MLAVLPGPAGAPAVEGVAQAAGIKQPDARTIRPAGEVHDDGADPATVVGHHNRVDAAELRQAPAGVEAGPSRHRPQDRGVIGQQAGGSGGGGRGSTTGGHRRQCGNLHRPEPVRPTAVGTRQQPGYAPRGPPKQIAGGAERPGGVSTRCLEVEFPPFADFGPISPAIRLAYRGLGEACHSWCWKPPSNWDPVRFSSLLGP